MADPNLIFDPPTGHNDTVVFKTNPAKEEVRGLMQRLHNQTRDFINGTFLTWIKSTFALKTEVQSVVLGQIPDGSLTDVKLSDEEGQIKDVVTTHLSDNTAHGVGNKLDKIDYIRAGGFAVTSGTSTAYTIELNPAPTAYADGQQFIINPHVDCGANPTLNINELGAGTILKQDGTAVAAGEILANKPLSLVRVGSSFFIRSSDSGKQFASGTVVPSSSTIAFVKDDGTSTSRYPATVSGLSFIPKCIVINYGYYTTVLLPEKAVSAVNASARITIGIDDTYVFRLSGNAYADVTGFRLPFKTHSITAQWFAWSD